PRRPPRRGFPGAARVRGRRHSERAAPRGVERGGPGGLRVVVGTGGVRRGGRDSPSPRGGPERGGMKQRPFAWGAALCLLFVAVYADPLFFRRNFAGRDLLPYNLPMEKAVHDAYARGRLPVWMSEVSGGRPLLPNPNAGALYPIRPLLSRVPFPLAMRIFPPLHCALAGLGLFCLLRVVV